MKILNARAWLSSVYARLKHPITLFLLTIIAPVVVSNYMSGAHTRLPAFHSLRNSFVTLIFCLVLFHLYLWYKRSDLSPNTQKHIDYIYLIVATIGLVSASDIDGRIYHHNIDNIVYLVQAHSSLALLLVVEEQKECDKKPINICVELSATSRRLKEIENNLNMERSSLEQAQGAFNDIYFAVRAFPKIQKYLSGNLEENGLDMNKEFKALYNPPFNNDDVERIFGFNFGLSQLRQLGFSLIASALALRIAKVTVELFGWRRK